MKIRRIIATTIGTLLALCFMFGFVFPFLFSAPSTPLVLLGIFLILGVGYLIATLIVRLIYLVKYSEENNEDDLY